MLHPADIEACHERLHRAGWSIGEVGTTRGWLVTGSSGENTVAAAVSTQAGAWRLACEQAAAVGMLDDEGPTGRRR